MEPWGPEAATWQLAVVATILANSNAKKGAKAYKPKDFMPKPPAGADFGAATPQQIKERFAAIAEKMGDRARAKARAKGGRQR